MNDFKTEYQSLKKPLQKAINEVLESGWYILGPKVEQFEKEFAAYVGSKYCIGVGNGLEALQISLMALGIKNGDEVITVSNTAVATVLAVTNIGAKPVFVDIDDFYHIDAEKIEAKITSKTKAILPVHLFGQAVDMKAINNISKKHHLFIVEDACQSHGAKLDGKMVGTFGNLGCFSFYPTKNLGGVGDGGAIITNDKKLYQKCLSLRNYGQESRYLHKEQGLNSRLDELQAAILSVKLKKLPEYTKKRRQIAQIYFRNLQNIPQIILPKERANGEAVYHLFVIQAERRDELQQFLKNKNIQTLIHYPLPIHKQACYPEYNKISLPITEDIATKLLSLPIHPFLKRAEIIKVTKAIREFYARS